MKLHTAVQIEATPRHQTGRVELAWKVAGRRFARKTKRPRLDLSRGTSVDQPSPKCCSRTTVTLTPCTVNGSLVPYPARTWWSRMFVFPASHLIRRNSSSVLAEGTQDNGATDTEANYGSQRCDHQLARGQVKEVGENRGQREHQADRIEPEWGADSSAQIFAQAQLQEQGRQPNGGENDERQRARKRRVPGIDNHEHHSEKEQAGGNQSPAASFVLRSRVGRRVGQGVVPSYTRRPHGFQMVIA